MKNLILLALLVALSACSGHETADLLIYNARIYTVDESLPIATSIVINGDSILAVGNDGLSDHFEVRDRVDAGGRFILPGFNDSHVHLMDGANNLLSVQLRDASTREMFIDRIADFASELPEGAWITGGDWDHTLWGGDLPEKEWIDSVTQRNPLWINRLDGHMALANSLAMELAQVDYGVGDVVGGEIVRTSGELTGIFKDNAMNLIGRAVPAPSLEEKYRQLKAAQEYLHSNGVTSLTDMGLWEHQEFYETALDSGLLKLRIYSCVPLSTYQQLAEKVEKNGRGGNWLRIGGLKGFVDGSLGSHTAAFMQPYSDVPTDSGFFVTSEETLSSQVSAATENGLHVSVHAIGDKAIRSLLDIYEVISAVHPETDHRFRIEHTQHLDPADIERFEQLNVIPSMQPYHAIDDGRWASDLIGMERSAYSYAFNSLLKANARLAFGSDWFVAPATPLEGIYAAVTRRTLDDANPGGWVPEQKINVAEAIYAYTMGSAYATFMEDRKGSLSPGKLADLIILDEDPFEVLPEDLRKIRVMETYIAGKKVWQRD